jgi:hypothetical protein
MATAADTPRSPGGSPRRISIPETHRFADRIPNHHDCRKSGGNWPATWPERGNRVLVRINFLFRPNALTTHFGLTFLPRIMALRVAVAARPA